MRYNIIFIALIIFCRNNLFAQKPAIDPAKFDKWSYVSNPQISNDGKYVAFNEGFTKVIKSTVNDWAITLPQVYDNTHFSQNNQFYLFAKNDSVGFCSLGTSDLVYQGGILSFQLFPNQAYNDWLVLRKKERPDELILRDLKTGAERKYADAVNFWLSTNGLQMILVTGKKLNNQTQLKWIDFETEMIKDIWEGAAPENITWNKSDSEIAFTAKDESGSVSIYQFKKCDTKPTKVVDGNSEILGKKNIIGGITSFSKNDEQLFFTLTEKPAPETKPTSVAVDVYSYKDPKLQSQQLNHLHDQNRYLTVLNLVNGKIIPVEDKEHQITDLLGQIRAGDYTGDFLLISEHGTGDMAGEWFWNPSAQTAYYLVSLKDGSKQVMNDFLSIKKSEPTRLIQLSPNGKYVIYYDPGKKNYFSYEIATKMLRNLTKGLDTEWTNKETEDTPHGKYEVPNIAGFLKEGNAALIYDRYDIYQVDLSKIKPIICLTNYYGKAHHTRFRLATESDEPINSNQSLLLHAFNIGTKDDGYFRSQTGLAKKPEKLYMLPCLFDATPLKARDAEVYMVNKMTAAESPNYFLTSDFKKFRQLSNVYPERQYNWLTSELITWKLPNGKTDQGILYKPENFDSHKKYPMIINYYERKSDKLNSYLRPRYFGDNINIPYLVSNGYLVFTPDIHFKIGSPGKSSMICVVSGAKYLSRKLYVNAKRIGLQGHSFGGFQTNYIVTHTHIFAAAVSASGMSDFVSIYNSIVGDGISRQRQYEVNRDRMGATLWQIPQKYIENSPVLRADKITTPLLIMANKKDDDVPYPQGVELFTALRRLGKKAWMLQYDEGGHSLSGKAAEDYTTRVKQFFDYYLKGVPPPVWMTTGVPASMKGIMTGLEIDKSGHKP